jgi:hypothetical protein
VERPREEGLTKSEEEEEEEEEGKGGGRSALKDIVCVGLEGGSRTSEWLRGRYSKDSGWCGSNVLKEEEGNARGGEGIGEGICEDKPENAFWGC